MVKSQSKTRSMQAERFVPSPPLVRKTAHVLAPGMLVRNCATPDERWVILRVDGFWCTARLRETINGFIQQCFPCDAMQPVEEKPSPSARKYVRAISIAERPGEVNGDTTPAVRRPRSKAGFDEIAARLAEAETVDELWMIASKLGVSNDPELRQSKAHLGRGLLRMWIGNKARAIKKEIKHGNRDTNEKG